MIRFTALFALLLAACSPATEIRPVFDEDGLTAPDARGVWRSAEYGWLLQVGPDGVTRWQDTPAACYVAPASEAAQFMGRIAFRFFSREGDVAEFRYLVDDESVRFQRLDALPAHCVPEAPTAETAVFEIFASAMAAHYAFFEERGVDWEARTRAARGSVNDGMGEAALFEVLAGMMDGLSDSHTKLIADIDGERRRVQDGQGTTLPRIRETIGETPWLIGLVGQLLGEVLVDGRHIGNDRVITGTIETAAGRRVGYLMILTMGGFDESETPGTPEWAAAERADFAEMMDEIIGGFADHDAVILDLSNNRGGYDAIARDLAARFADSPFEAYQVWPGSAPEQAFTHVIEPADGPRFNGPVAVLTSDVTVSGGEIATLALRQLDHVVHAGMTTRGAFSTPLAKPLPNGWYLELSNEVYTGTDGRGFEEAGLEPGWALEVHPADAPVAGHAAALRALAKRLVEE
jgi:carboxyl-terminal processing protease